MTILNTRLCIYVCRMKQKENKKPVSRAKRIVNIVTTVLSCLVLGVILFCLISVAVSKIKGEQPNLFGYSFLYILTDSMEPDLPVGTSILVKKCSAEDVKVGDYVSYKTDDELYSASGVKYVTHKCIEALHVDPESGKKVITTQGIKLGAPQETIEADRVEAVYVKKVSAGVSKFFSFMITPYGFATLICVPLLVAIALQLFSQIKSIAKKEAEKTDEELLKDEIQRQSELIGQSAKEYFEQEQEKIKEFLSKYNQTNGKTDEPEQKNEIDNSDE